MFNSASLLKRRRTITGLCPLIALCGFTGCGFLPLGDGGGNGAPIGGTPDPGPGGPAPPFSFPADADYAIVISGRGGFPSPLTSVPWNLDAVLVLRPQLPRGVGGFNGPNAVEVGIFTDPPAEPIRGFAGALWFGTNVALCEEVNCNVVFNQVDVAFVDLVAADRRIDIRMDSNIAVQTGAATSFFNIYNLTNSVFFPEINSIFAGDIEITFSADGDTIEGTIDVGGSSNINLQAITTTYVATFEGMRTR